MAKKKLKIEYLPHQPEVFDSTVKNVVYAKGRRAGGTTGAAHRLLELAHENPGSKHLWVDTTMRNIQRYVQRLFLPRLEGTQYKWDKAGKSLKFEGGSHCDFGSATRPELLEGFGYDCIWLNEAGIILKNPLLYFETLRPMVLESENPRFFFIGAPKGGGLFKAMYDWGQDPKNTDWASFRHSSFKNPLVNRAELERMKSHMPERNWRQEILAEFIEGEGAIFRNLENLPKATPEKKAQAGAEYVIGVDLARYHDFTVAWVGRMDRFAGVCVERYGGKSWENQVARLSALSRRFGNARMLVDATGMGDPVAEALQNAGLAVEPFVLTAVTKRRLIDSLALSIEQALLHIIPHGETLAELAQYQIIELPSGHQRTSAPSGGHDDCVIALALCHWGMRASGGEFILGQPMETRESDW